MILNNFFGMRIILRVFIIIVLLAAANKQLFAQTSPINNISRKSFHDFTVKNIDGEYFPLSKLKGKKVLVVNTASKCGLTPQYAVLQKLYESINKDKFEIVAFPANNFLEQEPGTNAEIKSFCSKNYGVTFPVMEKVSVCNYIYHSYPIDTLKATITSTHEIYNWLTKKSLNGVADTKIKWNFQKFLIDENGKLLGSLSPGLSEEILTLKRWLCD